MMIDKTDASLASIVLSKLLGIILPAFAGHRLDAIKWLLVITKRRKLRFLFYITLIILGVFS